MDMTLKVLKGMLNSAYTELLERKDTLLFVLDIEYFL